MKWTNTGLLLVVLIAMQACRRGPVSEQERIRALHLPDLNLLFENYERLDSTGQYASFANQLVMANRDLRSSELFVEAASLYDQAGHPDSVAILLHLAIDEGMANPNILSRMRIGEEGTTSPLWKSLYKRLDSIGTQLKNVENFSFETEAMTQFWPYFSRAIKDSANAKSIFKEYIFKGPRELRDFYAVRYYSTEAMYGQMINASPRYYSYLEKQFDTGRLLSFKDLTEDWMRNFQKLYPPAVFPKVYVVPGILNSGGTATEMGLFIGGDMYGKSEQMPTEELTEWQKDAIMEYTSLPSLTIHELMHFQQNYADPVNTDNVLFNLVQEGVCDLLVELVSGQRLSNGNLRYLEEPANRDPILAQLKADLFSDDLSRWMYNGGSIQDRPHDLGYTLGYLITKSYFQKQADKKKAVYELLNSKDLTQIVRDSDYAFLLEREIY